MRMRCLRSFENPFTTEARRYRGNHFTKSKPRSLDSRSLRSHSLGMTTQMSNPLERDDNWMIVAVLRRQFEMRDRDRVMEGSYFGVADTKIFVDIKTKVPQYLEQDVG